MADRVTIELNKDGVRALLRSPEMLAAVRALAAERSARCGAGYEADDFVAETRAVGVLYTGNAAAAKDNAENNTMLRELQ